MFNERITPLRRVRVGMAGQLRLAGAASASVQRLMSMGLVPGTAVKVVRVAPLGDPIVLEAVGFQLGLRRHEADGLGIEA